MNNIQRRRQANLKRRAEKCAAYRAAAESGKEQGVNDRRRSFNAHKHEHLTPNCGNVGCDRCFPRERR